MRLNSMLITAFALTLFVFRASAQDVSKIGVYVDGNPSAAAITFSLWHDSTVYQCQITPSTKNVEHTCTVNVLGRDCSVADTKLLIENDDADGPQFGNVFFETADGTRYTVQSFCVSDTADLGTDYRTVNGRATQTACTTADGEAGHIFEDLCIDTDAFQCVPSKQVVYFDTSRPNEGVTGAEWEDGTAVSAQPNELSCHQLDCASFEYCSADLASDVAAVTADVETITNNVAANTNDVAAVTADVSTITSNVAANTNNVATNTADLAALSARIDAIVAKLKSVQNASPVLDYHGVDGGDTNWWLVALLLVNINVIVIAVCIGVMCACGKVPKYQPVKAEAFDFEK